MTNLFAGLIASKIRIKLLVRFFFNPETTSYLRELANDFHTWYDSHQFLVPDQALRDARLKLSLATRVVLRNGLELLGVSAPETM